MGWTDWIPSVPFQIGNFLKNKADQAGDQDAANKAQQDAARNNLLQQSGAAGGFADQGQQGFNQLGAEGDAQRQYLRDLSSGKNSVSAEQLRQGNQQNLATQQSFAASAAPQNAAMAARNAAMNMGRASYGMSGQQAVAGLAERNAANQELGNQILGARGQDLSATLGSRGQAIGGYGSVLNGPKDQSWWDKYGQQALGAGQGALTSFAAMSDRRVKKNIKRGDADAKKAIEGLRAYSYKYKDERHGKGKQLGPLAQDLEKAGLGHTVIDTPSGKAVHGAKAALASLALVSSLGKRVQKLEGSRK